MTVSAEKHLTSAKHYCALQLKTMPLPELSVFGTETKSSSGHWSMPHITPQFIPRGTAKVALKIINLSSRFYVKVIVYSRAINLRLEVLYLSPKVLHLLAFLVTISILWVSISSS